MLVLGAKPGETIWLTHDGVDMQVKVVSFGDGSVKLGITAPNDVTILRDVVRNRINAGETQKERRRE